MGTIWGRLEGRGRGRQWAGGLGPASKHVGRGPSSRLPTRLPPASPPLRPPAPVPATTRVAIQDDVIPVSTPFVDKMGRHCDHVRCARLSRMLVEPCSRARGRVAKGDLVFLPILVRFASHV